MTDLRLAERVVDKSVATPVVETRDCTQAAAGKRVVVEVADIPVAVDMLAAVDTPVVAAAADKSAAVDTPAVAAAVGRPVVAAGSRPAVEYRQVAVDTKAVAACRRAAVAGKQLAAAAAGIPAAAAAVDKPVAGRPAAAGTVAAAVDNLDYPDNWSVAEQVDTPVVAAGSFAAEAGTPVVAAVVADSRGSVAEVCMPEWKVAEVFSQQHRR